MTNKYTEEQQKIVNFEGDQLRVIAAPGTGKTSTLVARICKLIERGILPETIFTLCFAKHDKKTILDRLYKKLPFETIQRLRINNYHGFGLSLIRDYGLYGKDGNEIKLLEESESRTLIKKELEKIYQSTTPVVDESDFIFKCAKKVGLVDVVFDLFNNLRDDYCVPLTQIGDVIEKPEFSRMKDEVLEKLKEINNAVHDLEQDPISPYEPGNYILLKKSEFIQICDTYGAFCKKFGYVDFMDMVLQAYLILKKSPAIADSFSSSIQHLLVDEFQDISNLQFQLVSLLSKVNDRIFAVGDIDQCQPQGTMVTLTGGQKKPIEDIRIGDQVTTYSRKNGFFVGIVRDGKKVLRTKSRSYNGEILSLICDKKVTRCTPEHKWIVRFKDKATHHYVTYLMKQGTRFRVGFCQLFNTDKNFHLAIRAKIEKAESAWILGIHTNKRDAMIEESVIAARFGIPTVVFQETNQAINLNRKAISAIFDSLGHLDEKAQSLLMSFGRDLRFPFYEHKKIKPHGRKTLMQLEACNLIPEIMLIPEFKEKKQVFWRDFFIQRDNERCTVYSLEIEQDQTYISDGIATHNCIYQWRNAKPHLMKDELPKRYSKLVSLPLSINFRSDKNVVECANKLIAHNVERLDMTMKAHHPAQIPVSYKRVSSIGQQADEIAELVAQYLGDKQNYWVEKDHKVAIILRSARSISAILIRNALFKKQIPVQLRFESKVIKDIMTVVCSILNLTIDPKSPADMSVLLSILPGIGEKTQQKILMELETTGSLKAALDQVKIPKAKVELVLSLDTYIADLHAEFKANENITLSSLQLFGRSFALVAYLQDSFSQGKGITENTALIDTSIAEIKESAERLIDYRDTLTAGLAAVNNIDTGKKPAVVLGTAHFAKGCEWEIVICPDLVFGATGFPAGKDRDSEEERRIFYVAITRAIKRLHLYSYVCDLQRNPVQISPYVEEMEVNKSFPSRLDHSGASSVIKRSGNSVVLDFSKYNAGQPIVSPYNKKKQSDSDEE